MFFRTCSLTVFVIAFLNVSLHAQTPLHLWSDRFGDGEKQYGYSVATDASGNVVVTGRFEGSVDFGGGVLTEAGGYDIFLAKFDASGNHLWSKRFGDARSQYGESVATDNSGNIVVTGRFQGSVDFGGGVLTNDGIWDIFLVKFDASGNHLWSKRFGDGLSQYVYSVATDASGNVVVTGYFQGTVDFGGGVLTSDGGDDIFLAKFDASGNHLWSERYGGSLSQYGWSVATDASGNVVLTGRFANTVDFGGGVLTSAGSDDIFLAKFGASGNHLWSDRFGDTQSQYGYSVATDTSGSIVVTGRFEGTVDFGGGMLTSAGDNDIFLAKFDASGNHLWSERFGDGQSQSAWSIATDTSGNVAVTGYFQGTVDFGGGVLTEAGGFDTFLAKFDASGNHLWSERFGNGQSEFGTSVATDTLGNVVFTGYFGGSADFGGGVLTSAGENDIFLAKFAPTATGIFDSPHRYGLVVNSYPNPFNPATTINYSVPSGGVVDLRVYDVQGRTVKKLVNEAKTAGEHFETWDGRDGSDIPAASGVYFVRLECNGQAQTRKIVLLK